MRRKSQPESWHLSEYISVASELGIIKPQTETQVKLAKNFRNLIHPGERNDLSSV